MAQRKSQSADKAPSQRQLRVGELIRYAAATLTLSLWSSAAMAEVCDKVVGEHWRGGGISELVAVTTIELAAMIALLGAAYLMKASWLAYVIAIFVLFRALLVVALMMEDDIYGAAVKEGCASLQVDQVHIGVLVIFAIACVWLGYRLRGRHAEAT